MFPESESLSHWQQNDYKVLGPSVTENPDFSKVSAIQNMPVTSVICEPSKNSSVRVGNDNDNDATICVKGYAFSGGGNKIARVDVSVDGGKTWTEATLQNQVGQNLESWLNDKKNLLHNECSMNGSNYELSKHFIYNILITSPKFKKVPKVLC
jgi:hypothetical protein